MGDYFHDVIFLLGYDELSICDVSSKIEQIDVYVTIHYFYHWTIMKQAIISGFSGNCSQRKWWGILLGI